MDLLTKCCIPNMRNIYATQPANHSSKQSTSYMHTQTQASPRFFVFYCVRLETYSLIHLHMAYLFNSQPSSTHSFLSRTQTFRELISFENSIHSRTHIFVGIMHLITVPLIIYLATHWIACVFVWLWMNWVLSV